MAPLLVWRIGLAVALGAAIIVSASVRPPRKPLPRKELRWPVLGTLTLYATGLFALLQHRGTLAIWLFAAGIAASSVAAWLSRASDGGGPPRGTGPAEEPPPEDPQPAPSFDWAQFEREFRAYSGDRDGDPVSSP